MSSFYFWMFVLLGALSFAWGVLKFFLKRFGHVEFVCNENNGVIAIARRDDFVRAKRSTEPGERVKVKNTLVFWSRHANSWVDKNLTIGESSLIYDWDIGWESEPLLFIPFVSNHGMRMVDQMKFFHRFTIEEAMEYIAQKSPFWILFWRWMSKRYDHYWNHEVCISFSLWVSCILCFLLWIGALSSTISKERRYEFITTTSATDPKLSNCSISFL
ncbi:MAG: hypothetical protein PHF35_04245 [Candidatus Moranbacteria bacterium]|nr:hypothetical protein [Candidatus Moranbacteria bacterium]